MSLRTSAHTGVAIRFPAEMPGKTVVHRANSQLLRICREELLFVMCCRRRNGLPRRFAPRNDMQKHGRCQRVQGRITCRSLPPVRTIPGHCRCTAEAPLQPLTPGMFPRTLRAASLQPLTRICLQHVIANHPLQPLTRHRLLHVIANQCAHWCGNPHPRSNTWQACRT